MKNLISVIVPIYKVEQYLNECIESIVKQTYSNLEIILVDDGSPDKCPAMCDEWALKDRRIKVIHKENGGLSDARNAGLNIALGEYIVFVDSDDWIASTMIEAMYEALLKVDADICACGIIDVYPNKEIIRKYDYVVGGSYEILSLLYDNTKFPVSAWNKLYKKSLWESLRFPVGKICEDAFTTYQLVDKAKKIVQISDTLYYYRIREGSIMTTDFSKRRMDEEEAWRCNYKYMKKKYPQIYLKAFDFYLQKVNVLIHTIPVKEKKIFEMEYKYLYSILKRNFWYVLFRSKMSFKYRIKFMLDFVRL